MNFYNRKNIEDITEGVKTTFIRNYKIDTLEKELKYSDTVAKRVQLADEHNLVGNYQKSLILYQSCLAGMHSDSVELKMKLLKNYYQLKEYDLAIEIGRTILDQKIFHTSDEIIALAWSYYNTNRIAEAEKIFELTDSRFSNYQHRYAYASFLSEIGKSLESEEKVDTLLNEIDSMDRYEQRMKKDIRRKIASLKN